MFAHEKRALPETAAPVFFSGQRANLTPMLHRFFSELRAAKIPVTTREYLTLLEALEKGAIDPDIDHFYSVSRAALVKDEKNFDKFDAVFGHVFKGVETLGALFEEKEIPDEWLQAMMERLLSEEERAAIEALPFEELMETLKKRLEEQEKRHEGGSKWIGTGGTSPYGHSGYNPSGVRIGGESRHKKAAKVWEKRRYKDLDGERELGTRNLKVALRRLRKFARDSAQEELDLGGTIDATARQGWLDVFGQVTDQQTEGWSRAESRFQAVFKRRSIRLRRKRNRMLDTFQLRFSGGDSNADELDRSRFAMPAG